MPSDDPLEAYRTDWERRKAISNKYGRPFYAGAALSLILYIFIELGLPESPNAQTGHVFRVRRHGKLTPGDMEN
jgi:hypothetical protein